jgi:ribonuclease-3 family protein
MADYLNPRFTQEDTQKLSSLGLAHIGDAVFELMVRSWMCVSGLSTAKNMHKASVKFVSAPAQAAASKRILPLLSQAEREVFIRGRNSRVNSVPGSATYGQYHAATGFEALFGYLYLRGELMRLNELFEITMDVTNGEET